VNASSTPAIHTTELGKRYGSVWALQDCSVTVPRGHVSALVGPNGAGKTTLLKLLVGLCRPSAGRAEVLGRVPEQSEGFLSSIGYLAQEVPLYKRLSADDHIEIGAHLNRAWDAAAARGRLGALRIPMDRPVATLSGGQRAQVGLSLVLAKRPQVLLLDEPMAALDPLARREFLASLTAAVAEDDLSVVVSSHLLHDLERICDHLILLSSSRVQLCGTIDEVLADHRALVGPRRALSGIEPGIGVVAATQTARQTRLLARLHAPVLDPSWEVAEVGLEEIVLAYMEQDEASADGRLVGLGLSR
jgi:ABC-2 type transport system ATP-binding protein